MDPTGPRAVFRWTSLAAALALTALASRADVQIERTIMPLEAAPSSFAIGLPGGVNFCFDPTRGGVSYAWTGGFIDLTNVRPGMGKKISEVKLLGPVVYQENGATPLRLGDPARAPRVEFRGYTLQDDAIEFRYTLDGVLVREEIRARPGGGLTRRFRVDGAKDEKWWYVTAGKPAMALARTSPGEFVLDITFDKATP
jgi:hypothetical protein